MSHADKKTSAAGRTQARVGSGEMVRLLKKAVNAMQCTIPVSRYRALAFGFFIFDGPKEWGLGCIYFDGPNYYLAAGNLGFGWGIINRPRFDEPNTSVDHSEK